MTTRRDRLRCMLGRHDWTHEFGTYWSRPNEGWSYYKCRHCRKWR